MVEDEVMANIGKALTELVDNMYPDDRGFIFITTPVNGEQDSSFLSNIAPENTIEVLEQIIETFSERIDNGMSLTETLQ